MFKVNQLGGAGAGWLEFLLQCCVAHSHLTPHRSQHSGTQHMLGSAGKYNSLCSCPYLSRRQRQNGPAQAPPHGHTHIMGEGIWCDPHNGLPEHLGLVVNAFDGQEDLRVRGQLGENRGESEGESRWGLPGGPGSPCAGPGRR